MLGRTFGIVLALIVAGCGSSDATPTDGPRFDAGSQDADPAQDASQEDAGHEADSPKDAGQDAVPEASQDASPDAPQDADAEQDASDDASKTCVGDTLEQNRNRLLDTYYAYLESSAATPQTNGLWSGNVSSAIDVWQNLDPSARAVFLTLTARMQGSMVGQDGRSMLSHVTRVYRVSGGEGATATETGSCGGAEYNRMIVSMDGVLRDALSSANAEQGGQLPSGDYHLGDVVSSSFWRDSHDLAGPHAPFDTSNETEGGAPRGQVHYFREPGASASSSPLGRKDLETLVDPLALEIDHDYDCLHNSNPVCTYILYGPMCAPDTPQTGSLIYVDSYGSYEATYQPSLCE